MFRTRQAPSPTGYLHFGTARTMLFTHLLAKANKGQWYLRLEDTDRARLQPDAVGSLLSSMEKLGLIPDEGICVKNDVGIEKDDFYGISQKGNFGPYIQSQRLEYYHKYAKVLLDKKLAYWSFLSEEDKIELKNIKTLIKKPINYLQANLQKLSDKPLTESGCLATDKIETDLYSSDLEKMLKDHRKPDLRFKIQENKELKTTDQLLGTTVFNLNLEEDFTILKSDGYPTYHFAHAIDDKLMDTTLVIRSQEWLSSLPKHYCLTQALWGSVFDYLHVPFVLGEVGNKKMSKRDGNVNMQDYLEAGYLPEAIINYLVFLGWNPGIDQEMYLEKDDFYLTKISKKERVEKLLDNLTLNFEINKMAKSPARFSIDKLKWFNQQYIKFLSTKEFVCYTKSNQVTNQDIIFALLDQERAILVGQDLDSDKIKNWEKPNIESLSFKNATNLQTVEALNLVWPIVIGVLEEFKTEKEWLYNNTNSPELLPKYIELYKKIEESFKQKLKEKEMQFGTYLFPLRVALSGQLQSPSPFEMMAIIPNEEIIRRINP
jgi:glutamyl-tRNA synthetase